LNHKEAGLTTLGRIASSRLEGCMQIKYWPPAERCGRGRALGAALAAYIGLAGAAAHSDPLTISQAARMCIHADLLNETPASLRPCLQHESADCVKQLTPYVERAEVTCGRPSAASAILREQAP
jgi:hypothetical protein